MFRTDFNHLLQSFDSHIFYKFMEYVSFMGSIYMLMFIVLFLISGVNFRKGFLILNILGWAALLTVVSKSYFDYPRPIAVDSSLKSFRVEKTTIDYRDIQPHGFFEDFSEDLLLKTRASDIGRQGFPSGHVLLITVLWIGMAILFKKKWLWGISVLLVLLTIISRMYLGVHYLGDVMGGLLFGILTLIVFNSLFNKLQLTNKLALGKIQVVFLLSPVLLLLFYNIMPRFQTGALIGFNLVLLTIIKVWGEPKLSSRGTKRVFNALLFSIIYFAGYFLARQLPLEKSGLLNIIEFIIVNYVVVFVAFYVGKLSRFYELPYEKIS